MSVTSAEFTAGGETIDHRKKIEMEKTAEFLEKRLKVLESTFFTGSRTNVTNSYPIDITTKLKSIQNRLDAVEAKTPDVLVCSKLVENLRPYIAHYKSNLAMILSKVEVLLSRKKEIITFIEHLQSIEKRSGYSFNKEEFTDIHQLQAKLDFFNEQLIRLMDDVTEESNIVDELLDTYEKAIVLVSDTSQQLMRQVKHEL